MTQKQNLIRGGSWAVAGAVLLALLGLGVNALLARLLQASELGTYFLLVSLIGLTATLAQGGVLQVLLRKVALSTNAKGKWNAGLNLKSATLYVVIGFCGVSFLLILFFDHWFRLFSTLDVSSDLLLLPVLFWLLAVSFQGVVTETFRGLHDIRHAVLFGGIWVNLVLISILIFLFNTDAEIILTEFLYVLAGVNTLVVIAGMLLLTSKMSSSVNEGIPGQLKSLSHESMPLLYSGLLAIVIIQGDLWLVGLYLGSEEAALYGAATRLAILAGMSLNLVNAVLPPHIAKLHASGKHAELVRLLQNAATFAGLPAIVMTIVAVIWGRDVLGYLYGSEFSAAEPILSFLALGYFFHVMLGSGGLVLMLTGRGKILLKISIFTSLWLIFSGLIVAPFGGWAIAAAAASALIIQKIAMWKWVKSELGISTHASFNRDFWQVITLAFRR